MPLNPIALPENITNIKIDSGAEEIIGAAYESITQFMLDNEKTIDNFVNCDFHLVEQALVWISRSQLMAGNRFCELGSGIGAVTILAQEKQMSAVGIEIESVLVDEAVELARKLNSDAEFFCGSFVPRDAQDLVEMSIEIDHVETQQGDVYQEIGLAMNDFDLFFAFPWPGESSFFESVIDAGAADGALLLTYRGRDGVQLVRKSPTEF